MLCVAVHTNGLGAQQDSMAEVTVTESGRNGESRQMGPETRPGDGRPQSHGEGWPRGLEDTAIHGQREKRGGQSPLRPRAERKEPLRDDAGDGPGRGGTGTRPRREGLARGIRLFAARVVDLCVCAT